MFPVGEFYLEDILVQVDYKFSNKVFQSIVFLKTILLIFYFQKAANK